MIDNNVSYQIQFKLKFQRISHQHHVLMVGHRQKKMGCVSLTLIHLSPTGTLPGTTVDNLEEIWPPFQIWKLKTI